MSSLILPSRRRFLQGGLAGAAGLAFSSQMWARTIGANDDIRLGFIGLGKGSSGRGAGHVGDFGKKKGCRVAAICDADTAVLDAMKKKLDGQAVEYYQDYRKLLENKDIDAVIIATPNHTHTFLAIAAMQAGKHVFVEKPVSHNMWEGRKLVEHAAKHPELIVQHGIPAPVRMTPGSANPGVHQNRGHRQGGGLRGFCYRARGHWQNRLRRPGSGHGGLQSLVWSPRDGSRAAEELPLRLALAVALRQWRHRQQGPHQLDVARWLVGDPMACPENVLSIGGRFGYDDDATTANTQIAFYDFKPVPVIFEVRGLPEKDMNFGASLQLQRHRRRKRDRMRRRLGR